MTKSIPAGLLVAGYGLLVLGWVMANPPGAAPDEPSNYIKAVAVGSGQFLGQPGDYPASAGATYRLTGPRLARASLTTRWVYIPSRLVPNGFACDAFLPAESARCLLGTQAQVTTVDQPTYAGTYQPFVYVLPGFLAWFANDAQTGLLLTRLGMAFLCMTLIAVAAWLLVRGRTNAVALSGLVVAVTPMVLFAAATVSASGPEICAGVCFFAVVLRIARRDGLDRWDWAALAFSGSVLALSRPLGALWMGLGALTLVLVAGLRPAWRQVRSGGIAAVVALAIVSLAVAMGLWWEVAFEPHRSTSLTEILSYLPGALASFSQTFRGEVGIFGWLDTDMPAYAYSAWYIVVFSLVASAAVLGAWRDRLVLLSLVVLSVVVTVVLAAGFVLPLGFGLQGRHVLAFTVAVPLLAGEILYQRAHRLPRIRPGHWLVLFTAIAVAVQAIGWLANARRYAVGVDGPGDFIANAQWNPPLGWWPWIGVIGVGCLAMLGAAIAAWPWPAKAAGSHPQPQPSVPEAAA